MGRTIFITGTDTGVGKTVVTALLAAHLRNAVALKPFSSGARDDAELLASLCGRTLDAINPWHFIEPVSPWSAARRKGIQVTLVEVLRFVRGFQNEPLIIEGAGGVLTPLGAGFCAIDLIRELDCDVILVTQNRLGVLNQTRMALAALGAGKIKIALTDQGASDPSCPFNQIDLQELVDPIPVIGIPFLPRLKPDAAFFRAAAQNLTPILNSISGQKNPPDTEAEGTFSLKPLRISLRGRLTLHTGYRLRIFFSMRSDLERRIMESCSREFQAETVLKSASVPRWNGSTGVSPRP